MASLDDLEHALRRIDGRGYGAYRDVRGAWGSEAWALRIERVQGDPFATPSIVSLFREAARHDVPDDLLATPVRRVALADYLLRNLTEAASDAARAVGGRGSGHSGKVRVDAGRAEILERSGCRADERGIEFRVRVGLPARGRRVLGRDAAELLCRALPAAASRVVDDLDIDAVRAFVVCAERHAALQETLPARGWVAFVADGSVLPRATGASSDPLPDARPFRSPAELRATVAFDDGETWSGMALPDGVSLVTGGGYHGKTTLLEAIQYGVYPHVPGDGRERVVTRADAVKIRSEDGRAVRGVDLSGFVSELPGGRDTACFSTDDASGSTSLAAALVEAIEAGAGAILLDEDTCATNLLVRDARMQELVRRETITPLIDRVQALLPDHGVSTVLVIGGVGDYLDVADRVLLMEDWDAHDATARASEVASARPTGRAPGRAPALTIPARVAARGSFDPRRGARDRVRARGLREIEFGEEVVDLAALEQLVDPSQVRAIGILLRALADSEDREPLVEGAARVLERVRSAGLVACDPAPELARPRLHELVSAANRVRSLRIRG